MAPKIIRNASATGEHNTASGSTSTWGKETLGNLFALGSLILAYQEKLFQLKDNAIVCLKSTHHTIDFNEMQHGEQIFRVFDNVCRQNMVASACGFNDYNTPIVSLQVIADFVNSA